MAAAAGRLSVNDYAREVVLDERSLVDPKPPTKKTRTPGERQLGISLTFAEHERLHQLAARYRLSLADYLRQCLLGRSGFDARKNVLELVVSHRLANKLTARAAEQGKTLSEYIVDRAQDDSPAQSSRGETAGLLLRLDQAKQSLDRIGNNVNQIARAAHTGRDLPGMSQATAEELAAERRRLTELLERVASAYEY